MFFLNLTAAEFFALLGTLGSLVAALYLLDRARRKRLVSTLQFWTTDAATDRHQARRKMRDPWSLILQLLSLLLLLLAVSDFEWGARERHGRDHVLLIDTSSWAGAQAAGSAPGITVLQREKAEATHYCSLLVSDDRVMLVAADSLATPLTPFTKDRRQLADAIESVASGYAALNLRTTGAFARQAQSWSGRQAGEIVYTGPALTDAGQDQTDLPDRMLPVPANRENAGIRQFSVEQTLEDASAYRALVRIKNYGQKPRSLVLNMRFGETAFAPRRVSLQPGAEQDVEYSFTTKGAGTLSVAIPPGDSLAIDDRAELSLPESSPLRVFIYTDRPEILKPLLAANRQLNAFFEPVPRYVAHPPADVVVLDRFTPPAPPVLPSLWIAPPSDHSPLPVKATATDALVNWIQHGALAVPLRAKALRVPALQTYQAFEGDETIATAAEGPTVVLRSASRGRGAMAVIGFDPAAGPLRFEVATPLLFAALLEELNPLAFRTSSFTVEPVGLANVVLDREEQHGVVRVNGRDGSAIPFTRHASDLQLFVRRPETVSISSEERERLLELRLPAVADHLLQTGKPAVGLPDAGRFLPPPASLWKLFALAGAICLLLEWFLFGPGRRYRLIKRMLRPDTLGSRDRLPKREVVMK